MGKLVRMLRPWKWFGEQLRLQKQVRARYPQGTRIGTFRYGRFKLDALRAAATDPGILRLFRENAALPEGFGWGVDERIVEYPWVFARLAEGPQRVLDAGSTFNYRWIAELPLVREKSVVIYTLAPEGVVPAPNFSYVYGDLRSTILRDHAFEVIACISTLEHVGMNNTWFYTRDQQFGAIEDTSFKDALREFHRLLVPGGRLLLTVPFGRSQALGWLRQFDAAGLAEIESAFGGASCETTVYRYAGGGWRLSNTSEAADSEYLYVPLADDASRGGAASATAVACMELVR